MVWLGVDSERETVADAETSLSLGRRMMTSPDWMF
jgi:hypothetical protein